MLQHVCDLMAHLNWADAVFYRAWGKAAEALEDEDLRRRAYHAVYVQEAFYKLLRGEAVARPQDTLPAYSELKERAQAGTTKLQLLAGELTAEGIARPISVPWFQSPPCVISVREALVQVAMHSQHHRGQNIARLKQIGGEPKNVDWIIWLWKGKPEGVWD
mgnify:CR=1 FL=1